MLKKVVMRLGNEEIITPGGLATVGTLISKTNIYKYVDRIPVPGKQTLKIKNSDCIGAQIALLCQSKSDFADVNELREDPGFYQAILGTKAIPSEETLRQRLKQVSKPIIPAVKKANVELLVNAGVKPGPCFGNHIPLDIDTAPFDNSNSKKEGVSKTYKNVFGYSPIMAYLGYEGYFINTELRTGSQHGQKGTPGFLIETIKAAKKVTGQPLLARMDSAFDCGDNIEIFFKDETKADFIIKRNLRNESIDEWVEKAKAVSVVEDNPRDGKTVYIGSVTRIVGGREVRIVFEVSIRTSEPNGQMLLVPKADVDTYWTSLRGEGENAVIEEDVIELYRQHATSEQFHSEIKTDMDLERFPSGHFETNAAFLAIGMFAYNILRIMGQESLRKDDAPSGKGVFRRRIKTVIQNLVTIGVRVVRHARKIILSLGRSNAWRQTYLRVHTSLAGQSG